MSTYNFNEISATGTRSGVCRFCGKRGRRQRRFYQTLNPFNRNEQGAPKTAAEISVEVSAEAHEWSLGEFVHAGCE